VNRISKIPAEANDYEKVRFGAKFVGQIIFYALLASSLHGARLG
jgi:hypothetical protein